MKVVDVKNLKINDVVKYLHHEEGKSFFIETGIVKSENLYEDGITVHDIGGQWKQYVGRKFTLQLAPGCGDILSLCHNKREGTYSRRPSCTRDTVYVEKFTSASLICKAFYGKMKV